ncbi:hypothetical protein Tco_1469253 [Tanacetum coccineum]
MLGCSWRGHVRGVHIYYCPSVLGGDICEGYIFITARVFLEGTPAMGTYGFHYCPGVLGGDTYDGFFIVMQLWDKYYMNFKKINGITFQTTPLEVVLSYLVLLYYEVTLPDIFPMRHIFGGVTLVHAARRLRRYFQAHPIQVLTDKPIKQILVRPEKSGRIAKWAIKLRERDIEFKGRDYVKRRIPADFLVETPPAEDVSANFMIFNLFDLIMFW